MLAARAVAERILAIDDPIQRGRAVELFKVWHASKAATGNEQRRLLDFTRATFSGNYQVNWHHERIAAALDEFAFGDCKRLMLFVPPQHGKTELASRSLPAYIFGRNPNARIIGCSHTATFAEGINRNIQRIIDSDAYRRVFPDTKLGGDNIRTLSGSWLRNSDTFEIVGHRGSYVASGVGGTITGRPADYIIVDDPIKGAEEAFSKVQREKLFNWFVSEPVTRSSANTRIMIINTRWHEDDLCGQLLAREPEQWRVVRFPAICVQEGGDDPRKVGEALWPERHPIELLLQKKALSGYMFEGLYQQNPTPPEGSLFQRSWWQFYDVAPSRFDEVLLSWDCAFKNLSDSDYVVGQAWGKIGGEFYLLDQVRARLDFPGTIAAVKNMAQRWPQARRKLVEDKANGTAVLAQLRQRVPGLIPVEPQGGKEARAAAISPYVQAGNVKLPRRMWRTVGDVGDFIEECAAFPRGANDDQVDAMSQALVHWAGRGPVFSYTPGMIHGGSSPGARFEENE